MCRYCLDGSFDETKTCVNVEKWAALVRYPPVFAHVALSEARRAADIAVSVSERFRRSQDKYKLYGSPGQARRKDRRMSLKVIHWVMAQNIRPPSRKLALIVLAYYSNSRGECTLSRKDLATVIGINERNCRRNVTQLEKDKFLNMTPRWTKRGRLRDLITVNFIPSLAASSDRAASGQKLTLAQAASSDLSLYSTTVNVPGYTNVFNFPAGRKNNKGND